MSHLIVHTANDPIVFGDVAVVFDDKRQDASAATRVIGIRQCRTRLKSYRPMSYRTHRIFFGSLGILLRRTINVKKLHTRAGVVGVAAYGAVLLEFDKSVMKYPSIKRFRAALRTISYRTSRVRRIRCPRSIRTSCRPPYRPATSHGRENSIATESRRVKPIKNLKP